MVDEKVLEVIRYFTTILESKGIRVNDLIVFGSSSAGPLRPGSDIDIAIISGDFSGRDDFFRAVCTKDAERETVKKFRIALDILTLTPEELRDQNSPIASAVRKGVAIPPSALSA